MTRWSALLIAGFVSVFAAAARADWVDTFAGGTPEQFWAFRYNPTNSGSATFASGTAPTTMGSLTVTTSGMNLIGYGVVPTNSFAGTGVVVSSIVNPFGGTVAGPRVGVVAQVDPALGTGYLATIDTSASTGVSTLSLDKAVNAAGSTISLGTAAIAAFSGTGRYTVELQVLGSLVNARVYDSSSTLVAQTSAFDSSPYGSGFAGVGVWSGTSGTSATTLRGTWGTTEAAAVAGPGGALIWAPNGGIPSGTATVATGTWNTAATTWISTTGTAPSAWVPTKTAYFGGSALSSGGSVVVSGTAGVSVAAGMKFEVGGYRITGTSGGQIVLGSSTQQIDVGPNFTATITAPVSGSGALEKVGMGTLVLEGPNSYGGGTRITRGTLLISSSAAVPGLVTGGISVAPNATLAVTNGVNNVTVSALLASGSVGSGTFGFDTSLGNRNFGASISGSLSLVKLGGNLLTLSGTNTYTGLTTISSGTLRIAAPTALPGSGTPGRFLVAPGAVLTVTNDVPEETVTAMLGTGNVRDGGFGFDTGAGDRGFSGSISGSLSLVKTGSNTLTLSGTNSYSGGTIVSTGTLRGSATTLQGPISNNAAVFFDQTTTGSYTGMMSGSGSLTKLGMGTLTLSGSNSYSGGTVVSEGILRGNATSLFGAITNDAAVVFDQSTSGTYAGTMSGSGSLTKLGPGDLTLTGTNSYSGSTIVLSGTLRGSVASLRGPITNSAAVVFDQATTGTYSGVMDGSGSLTKLGAGDLTLTGTNVYSGGTVVSTGTLRGSVTSLQGPITNNAAVVFDQATTGTYTGMMSGSGGLTKLGLGTLTLAGRNSYRGGTRVISGTLRGDSVGLQGSIANSAVLEFAQVTSGTYEGNVSGTGTLTKSGPGTLTLSGTSTYTGRTLINEGALVITSTTALPGSGTIPGRLTVSSSGALVVGNGISNAVVTAILNSGNIGRGNFGFDTGTTGRAYQTPISGSMTLFKLGAGQLTLNNFTGTNSYAGALVQSGTLRGTTSSLVGTISIADTATVLFEQLVSGTFSGVVTGSGQFVKGGLAPLTLSGTNSYSGGTLVSSGSLIGNAASLQGNITNDTSVEFNQAGLGTYAGNMAGSGSLTKTGNGVLTLSGSNSYSGSTSIQDGVLTVGSADALGSAGTISFGSGTLRFSASNTSDYSGRFSSGSDQFYRIDTAGQSVSFGSPLAGGSLTKLGSGTLSLAAANTYGGTTRVAAGTLALSNTGALATSMLDLNPADSGSVAFAVPGTQTYTLGALQGSRDLDIGTNAVAVGANGQSTEHSGVVSGSGSLWKLGSGTLSLSGANSYSGGTRINAGVLALGSAGALGSTGTISFGGGTLRFSPANTSDYSGRFSSASGQQYRIDTAGQSVSFASPLESPSGTLTKLGSGTLALSGNNSYSGGTHISDGVLVLNSANALGSAGTISFGSGTLRFSASGTSDYSGRFSTDLDQHYRVDTAGQSVSFGSPLASPNGSLTKLGSGTLSLAAANTYGGTTRVAAGTLALSNTGALATSMLDLNRADSGSVAFAVPGTQTYTLGGLQGSRNLGIGTNTLAVGANGQSTEYSGVLSGLGSITKIGVGELKLAAANTYSGITRAAAGTLALTDPQALAGSTLDLNPDDSGSVAFAVPDTETYTLGGLQGSRNLDAGTNSLVVGGNGRPTEYTGVFSGSGGSLTKTGTGTLTVAYSFSSGTSPNDTTRVQEGALVWSAASAQTGTTTVASTAAFGLRVGIPSSFTTADVDALFKNEFPTVFMAPGAPGAPGASVAIDVNAGPLPFTYSTDLPSGRGLFKLGLGTLILDGASSAYNSETRINAGVLSLGSADALGSANRIGLTNVISFGGGTLQFSASNTTDYSARFSDAPGQAFAIDTNGQNVSFVSNLTSSGGSLTKSGLGTLTLTGTNSYSGLTTITRGTLQVGSGGGTGSLGSGDIANAGTLVVNRTGSLSIPGAITGTGAFTHSGSGTTTLSGNNSYSGGTTLSAGVVALGSANAIGPTGVISFGSGTLQFSASNTTDYSARFSDAPGQAFAIDTNGQNVSFVSNLTSSGGSLTKSGLGTLTLTGNNSYSGLTTITRGTLQVGSGGGTGSLGSGDIANAGTLVVNRTGSLSIPGAITGTGSFTHSGSGTTTLFGNNSYSGGTTVSGGKLVGTTSSLQGAITNNALVEFGQPTSGTYAGIMSGTGSLIKTGNGVVALKGNNTLSGSAIVQGGVLQLASSSALSASRLVVVAGGTGQVAPVTRTGVASLDLASGNGLMDLTSGAITIASGMTATELVAELLEGRAGDSWTGPSGITSSTVAAQVAAGVPRAVGWIDNGDGSLTAAYAAQGDTNVDWSIDILDASNFLAGGKFDAGTAATWTEGDFSYDGIVDILDASDFFATGLYDAGSYNTAPGISGGVAAVPEPAGMGLLAGTGVTAWLAARIGRKDRRRG